MFTTSWIRRTWNRVTSAATARTALSFPGTAITQTYSTAAATVPAATTHAITDNSAGTPSTTAIAALSDGSTYGNDVAALRNNLATLAAEDALVKADVLALKKVVNQIIDDLQASGIQS